MAKFIILMILIFSGLEGFTGNVPIEKARIVAINWYRHYAPIEKTQGNILNTVEYKLKDATNFYIFSFDKGGFVIVSANDQVDPVLGYGFEGNVPDVIDNPAVKDCFYNYAQQIDTISGLNLKSAKVDLKWDQLTKNIFLKSGELSIGPLLTTTWNQGCYYNTFCPADANTNGTCGHVWTGCTATAMAQVMKYWNFPTTGTGSHSYTHSTYGNLMADFGSTNYQWSQMPNNVTSQNDAVATLMYHCGVSVDMNYSPVASGGGPPRDALVNYFKYSSQAKYVRKGDYSEIDWVNLLKSELDLQRPIWYEGFNPSSGHAFVCDGYQNSDYFHFNWGWGGSFNGYYYLGNLNSDGGDFSSGQAAIINIVPTIYAGFFLLDNTINLGANGGASPAKITSNVNWTVSSNQAWLSLNTGTGLPGTSNLILTATQNNTGSMRSATVTVSATGYGNQLITVNQYPKVAVTSGGLSSALTATELSTVTNLVLTGTIDARDFKTMRDNMPMLAEIDLSGVTVAAYTGTGGTEGTNSIAYPANTVPDYAFYTPNTGTGKSLTTVVLPLSISSIGSYAFGFCSVLTSVNIPSSVTSIGMYTFDSCSGLTSIIIPSSVTTIGSSAFEGFSGLINVEASNVNYSSLEGVLFNKTKTTLIQCPTSKTGTYAIPSTVTSTGWNSFWHCSGLTSIIIPSSVKTIDVQSFWGCNGLTSITIPSSVTFIGKATFTNCTGLASFVFPSTVTTIDDYTFQFCSGLKSVVIPSSITSIGNQAFIGCTGLTSIYANPAVPVNLSGSVFVFYNVNLTTCTLYVPYGTKALYAAAVQWKDFTNIVETANSFPAPALSSILTPSAVCSGSLFSYTPASSTSGVTFNWTRAVVPGISNSAASGTGNIIETFVNTTAGPVVVTYVYTLSVIGSSGVQNVAVVINPLPSGSGTITGATTVCQGQNAVTYTVPAVANAISYIWTLPNGATGTSATNSITVNYGASAVSGNITVRGHNNCGDGTVSTMAIIVNPPPSGAGTITGATTVCQGQNAITYTIPAVTNATSYVWTLPTGATGSSTTNSIMVNYGTSAVSGNITVKGQNTCGEGVSSTLSITVNPLTTSAGTISGTTSVCQGQNSVTYTVPAIANATSYVWILPTGATGTSSTNSITVNYGTSAVSGNITVKGHNSCGDGAESTLLVTVITGVIPNIIAKWGDVLICTNLGDLIASYQWYNGSSTISGAIIQYYATNKQLGTYKVETIDKNGCKNSSNAIVISSTKSLTAYPNPASVSFTLKLNDVVDGRANISIFNSAGIKVIELQAENINEELLKEIAVNNLDDGIYVIQVMLNQKELYYAKMIVKK